MSLDPKYYRPLQIIAVGVGLALAAYFGLGDNITNLLNAQLQSTAPVVTAPVTPGK